MSDDSGAVAEQILDFPDGDEIRSQGTFAANLTSKQLRAQGKAGREVAPLSLHAVHVEREGRVAVDMVLAGNEGRRADLVPLRMARMASDPFAFFRGSAVVHAHDLDAGPATEDLTAQICGDAHVHNFGFFASPERRLVMDLNDFDETAVGPFEYDLKRLLASLVVGARSVGLPAEAADDAVYDSARAYQEMTRRLAKMSAIDAWHVGFDREFVETADVDDADDVLEQVIGKANANDSGKFVRKWTTGTGPDRVFRGRQPILTRVHDQEREMVCDVLDSYVESMSAARMGLLSRFAVADVAFRVVGVGSVGTPCYIVLLTDSNEDPFVLQLKATGPSCLAGSPRCTVPAMPDGQRVVVGQRLMQTWTDPMLGWASRGPFYVRTFRDRKGSAEIADLGPHQLDDYGRLTAALLAKAHSRTLEPHLLTGYLGKSDELATRMVAYSNAYADQVERDFEEFSKAIASGEIVISPER